MADADTRDRPADDAAPPPLSSEVAEWLRLNGQPARGAATSPGAALPAVAAPSGPTGTIPDTTVTALAPRAAPAGGNESIQRVLSEIERMAPGYGHLTTHGGDRPGDVGSQHAAGTAGDISLRGLPTAQRKIILDALASGQGAFAGINGLGTYNPATDLIHFDFRQGARNAWGQGDHFGASAGGPGVAGLAPYAREILSQFQGGAPGAAPPGGSPGQPQGQGAPAIGQLQGVLQQLRQLTGGGDELSRLAQNVSATAARGQQATANPPARLQQPTPPRPEAFQTDTMQALGSIGSVLGIIAGAFTRTPMIASFNAAAQAITASRAGDNAAYTRAFDLWKEQSQRAVEAHSAEVTDFNAAMAKSSHDISGAQAAFTAAAARNQNQSARILAEAGVIENMDRFAMDHERQGIALRAETTAFREQGEREQLFLRAKAEWQAANPGQQMPAAMEGQMRQTFIHPTPGAGAAPHTPFQEAQRQTDAWVQSETAAGRTPTPEARATHLREANAGLHTTSAQVEESRYIEEKARTEAARTGRPVTEDDRLFYRSEYRDRMRGVPVTETQSNALIYGTREAASNEIMQGLWDRGFRPTALEQYAMMQPASQWQNAVLRPEAQQWRQAAWDFVAAKLRKESGAAIAGSEFATDFLIMIPGTNADPGSVDQMRRLRERVTETTLAQAGRAQEAIHRAVEAERHRMASGGPTAPGGAAAGPPPGGATTPPPRPPGGTTATPPGGERPPLSSFGR